MSDLECNHCGGIAFTSRTSWFTDGDGEKCADCGMPGCVSVDAADPEDASVTWNDVQDVNICCERPDCEDCEDVRAANGVTP